MRSHLKRNLMLGVALAAVIAGVLIAVLSGGHHHGRAGHLDARPSGRSDIQIAADYLGMGAPELRRRLRSGETMGQVAQTTAGRTQAGLLDALLTSRAAVLRSQKLPPSEERERLARLRTRTVAEIHHARHKRSDVAAAARYLAVGEAHLRAELRSGRTLAQIASSTGGRSAAGLTDALVRSRRQRLEAELSNGKITASQERLALASLRGRVTNEINRRLLGG